MRAVLLPLLLLACDVAVPASSSLDWFDTDTAVTGTEGPEDSTPPSGDSGDSGDSGQVDTDTTTDSPPPPVDCQPVSDAGHDLCLGTVDRCEAVFTDGAGCTEVCAEAGLLCAGAWENVSDACLPDLARPPLACDSGHGSDFCVCTRDGAGTAPATQPPPFRDRAEQLLAERLGFGRGARGGDFAGHLYKVTTLADEGPGSLRAALEDDQPWYVIFEVDGTITWEEDVRITSSRKTVDGRGHTVIVDGTWKLEDVHDIILSDLSLKRSERSGESACSQSGDVISIRGDGGKDPASFTSHDLWFHHLELYEGGDGLLDIRGGTGITLSWTHLHSHRKAMLAWQVSDGDEAEGMQVTFHHNHFDRVSIRGPRFHYGQAHFLNNFQDEWWHYGSSSYDGAQFASEANVWQAGDNCVGIPQVVPCVDPNPCGDDNDWFVNRKKAVVNEDEGNDAGWVRSTGDLLLGGAQLPERDPSKVFDPRSHYAYVAEAATAALAARIEAEAGPRRTWSFP
ncbi:MAG: hypothetical protein H6732_06340 [Alphaproteobacteria bacterium]|nr:hypothetical protein [Alphaproteobacteria bacterium]